MCFCLFLAFVDRTAWHWPRCRGLCAGPIYIAPGLGSTRQEFRAFPTDPSDPGSNKVKCVWIRNHCVLFFLSPAGVLLCLGLIAEELTRYMCPCRSPGNWAVQIGALGTGDLTCGSNPRAVGPAGNHRGIGMDSWNNQHQCEAGQHSLGSPEYIQELSVISGPGVTASGGPKRCSTCLWPLHSEGLEWAVGTLHLI